MDDCSPQGFQGELANKKIHPTYIIFAILFYSSQFILDNSIGYPIHFIASIYWMRRTIDTGIINKILNSLQRCICLIYFHPYFFWGKKKIVPKAQNVDFCLGTQGHPGHLLLLSSIWITHAKVPQFWYKSQGWPANPRSDGLCLND